MGFFDLFKRSNSQKVAAEQNVTISYVKPEPENIPSLQSRISKAVPSKRGLYPHEILMLEYASSFRKGQNTFQSFWKYKYSVIEPQKVLDSLFERGFIKVCSPENALSLLKVSELKSIITDLGAKPIGKKDDLIKQIVSLTDSEELKSLVKENRFELTEIGKAEVEENKYVLFMHKHDYMSVWDMNIALNVDNTKGLDYRDIIWGDLNKKSIDEFGKYNFGLYRNARFTMFRFLLEEKNYSRALYHLVEVAAYDFSRRGNNDRWKSENLSIDELIDDRLSNLYVNDNNEISLPPGIIKYFQEIKECMNISDSDFGKKVYDEFAKVNTPLQIFSQQECANIVLAEIGVETRKLNNSYMVAKQRLQQLKNVN